VNLSIPQVGLTSSQLDHRHHFWNFATATQSSVTDKTYAILLIAALGLSVMTLLLSRIISGDPIFSKEVIKLRRFRAREYKSLPTHVQTGNGLGHVDGKMPDSPEPLNGCRLRMGILHTAVIASLVAIHVLILLTVGLTMLRIAFVIHWV
jgi:hypothetical protein